MRQYNGLVRVDEFIGDHIDYIEGKSLLITANLDKDSPQEEVFTTCKICNNNLLPRHLSSCNTCDEFIHKTNCSIILNDKRFCSKCLTSDPFARKQLASSEIENWRGKGQPVPKKTKTVNSNSVQTLNSSADVHNGDDRGDDSIDSSEECQACKDGNFPTGLHKCIECGKNVHLFENCSSSIGDAEGSGEKRICRQCLIRTNSDSDSFVKTKEPVQTVNKTQKKSYRPAAKYLGDRTADVADSLFWENNKPLPVIKNGNHPQSAPVNIASKSVSLKNTCAYDSILYLTLIAALDFKHIESKVCINFRYILSYIFS